MSTSPSQEQVPPSQVLNPDIWREILFYFEVDLDQDNTGETRAIKRKTMYHIALLFRESRDCALDSLWKSMDTVEPVIKVLNAAPNSNEEHSPRVYFDMGLGNDPSDTGSWVVQLNTTEIDYKHVSRYLRRIKHIHLNGWKEAMLWEKLGTMHGNQLKALSFHSTSSDPWNYCSYTKFLEPILSHSLESISIYSMGNRREDLFSIIPSRCKDLTSISYRGDLVKHPATNVCLEFQRLKTLKLNFEVYSLQTHSLLPRNISFSLREKNPCLTHVEYDTRAFPDMPRPHDSIQSGTSIISYIPISHDLKTLHIIGDSIDITHLFSTLSQPLKQLHSLTISIAERPHAPIWGTLLPNLCILFPHLCSLTIRRASAYVDLKKESLNNRESILYWSDVSILFSHWTTLTSFCVDDIPNFLSPAEILCMAKAWPLLETLRISNPTTRMASLVYRCTSTYTSDLLFNLSCYSQTLKELTLPLDKWTPDMPSNASFVNRPPDYVSTSTVKHLTITRCGVSSMPAEDVVNDLMIIFPKLVSIKLSGRYAEGNNEEYYKLLQKLINIHHQNVGA